MHATMGGGLYDFRGLPPVGRPVDVSERRPFHKNGIVGVTTKRFSWKRLGGVLV